MHQRGGVPDVPVLDRVRGPVGERADRPGRIVRCVVREHVGADHEQVMAVPALQNLFTALSRGLVPMMVPPVLWVDWYGTTVHAAVRAVAGLRCVGFIDLAMSLMRFAAC